MLLNIALSILMLFSNELGILAVVDYKNGTEWPGKVWKIALKNKAAIPLYATERFLILLDADSCLHALSPDDGKVVWQRCTNIAGLSYVSRVETDVVLRDGASENLIGVDESTGTEKWRKMLPASGCGFYVTDDGSIYYHESVLHSYDLKKKEGNWQSVSCMGTGDGLATDDGWLYFFDDYHTIVAMMKADGRRVWSQRIFDNAIWPGAICGNKLLLMANSKEMVAYNRNTGEQVWVKRIDEEKHGETDRAPVLIGTDSSVYVLRWYDNLKKYSCNNGEKEWESSDRWSVVGPYDTAEVIHGKYLQYIRKDGNIHLYDVNTSIKVCVYNSGGRVLGVVNDRKRMYVSSTDFQGLSTTVQAIDIDKCIEYDPSAGLPASK